MMIFGVNPIRGEIIRLLARNPEGMTTGAIQRELDATYHTVFRHVRELEEAGVVQSDAGEHRQGQRVIYRLDTVAIRAALGEYEKYLLD